MALVLPKSVFSKNVLILKCMKRRNVAYWAKRNPAVTTSYTIKSKGFSTQRVQAPTSWPLLVVKKMPAETTKKRANCYVTMLQKNASCSTLATGRINHNESPVQRSSSLLNLNPTPTSAMSRACSTGKKGNQMNTGPVDICAMGPCNCPWPGGCPPPGFQQAACNPCSLGMGCCSPCPQCSPCGPAQCPCCGQCGACGPCVPCGACGACGMPMGGMRTMGGMGMAGGMPPMPMGGMGSCGTWGPCGGASMYPPQGAPCPYPCPCSQCQPPAPGQDPSKKKA